ncbi:hypothetical protein AN2355.2 [Aspergillus nidulans FGSC A4]|uniref:RTA1 domain protein, putative (AFU_orthologue AFUA_6G11810) n=1 Tax=Emericella nidulans (strain FGSC A4 / ATCC 38163 / CBS 112.46 / NRRL 194 / M139) TaxID=227321 RepID=Q5BAS5_EMENI|nr:hypothetical protein [Aspergillus nidulans FGSC A4]EAA64466.1 hypothetical protein AN2355.2 [Aspergillus nidulans FGSC A4]CBF86676.1 TPA: RTA1 domain protein, putative (AFU_orthologue; AFUA_6G11810) [Aspergillus nidulans FGSC A4]|eukprot:XP_659959.1 hypothetical protein AN2355.2 [Aspergillus nidulans FGSC A4]
MAAAVLFTLLFIGTTGYHIFQMFKSRTWFFVPFVIGGISLLAASVYMFLGRIILILQAESHALLRRKWLTKIFVTGDVLSFLLQGAGGGIQSSGNLENMKTGEHIIVVGLFVQIFFFGFFIITASHFHWKIKKYPIPRSCTPDIPWSKHLHVLYLASFLIMVRSIFRLAEYLQGNNGYLLHHEIFLCTCYQAIRRVCWLFRAFLLRLSIFRAFPFLLAAKE